MGIQVNDYILDTFLENQLLLAIVIAKTSTNTGLEIKAYVVHSQDIYYPAGTYITRHPWDPYVIKVYAFKLDDKYIYFHP